MLFTLTSTRAPATDLGYLLHKSPARALDSNGVRSQLRELRQALPGHHAKDLSNLVNLFRLGGLHSRLL